MRSTSMLGSGMVLIGVPLSVGYSFHSMQSGEDKGLSIIAFILSLGSLAGVFWYGWELFS